MMGRKSTPAVDGAPSIGSGAIAMSPPAVSRWLARVHGGLRVPDASAPAPGLFDGVRWTVPFLALLAYIVAITTYKLPIGSLAMIVGLAGIALQAEPRRFPWMLGWFSAFILWCAICYVGSPYPQRAWDGLVALVKLWAIVLVGVNALRSRPQIRLFTVLFLACFAFFPLRGALENYFVFRYTVLGRAIWNLAFENPNDLAAFAVLQLSMVAALLAVERQWWVKRACQLGLILLPLLVLMTQSRGGFIALALFTGCCAVGQWRYLRRLFDTTRRIRLVILSAAILAAVTFFAPGGVWKRVAGLKHLTSPEQLDEVDAEGSARQRWEIWRVAVKIIHDHTVLGVGTSAYPLAHEIYARGEEFEPTAAGQRDTHSTILNLLAETGVPGTLIFLGLIGCVAFGAERVRRDCARRAPQLGMPLFFLEAGLLSFFAAGIFGSFAYLAFLHIQLVLLWATGDVTRRELASRARGVMTRPSVLPASRRNARSVRRRR